MIDFHINCDGIILCGTCKSLECKCDEIVSYACNKCCHKMCNWCGNQTQMRTNENCDECCEWDYVGDVCEFEFCVNYLGAKGIITSELICDKCHSISPMIRVPLAFPLLLSQIIIEYPKFESIKTCFLQYYSYSHANGVWEPYTNFEFVLAQKYFDFDAGIIVLGRTKKEELVAKNKDAIKMEKKIRKDLKKERRLLRLNK